MQDYPTYENGDDKVYYVEKRGFIWESIHNGKPVNSQRSFATITSAREHLEHYHRYKNNPTIFKVGQKVECRGWRKEP